MAIFVTNCYKNEGVGVIAFCYVTENVLKIYFLVKLTLLIRLIPHNISKGCQTVEEIFLNIKRPHD